RGAAVLGVGGVAVDPHGPQAQPLGGDVVVVQALGDVQHLVLGDAHLGQLSQGEPEVVGGRLVGAGVVGGDDGVKGHAELGVAVAEGGAGDVGGEHQLVVPLGGGEGPRG